MSSQRETPGFCSSPVQMEKVFLILNWNIHILYRTQPKSSYKKQNRTKKLLFCSEKESVGVSIIIACIQSKRYRFIDSHWYLLYLLNFSTHKFGKFLKLCTFQIRWRRAQCSHPLIHMLLFLLPLEELWIEQLLLSTCHWDHHSYMIHREWITRYFVLKCSLITQEHTSSSKN